MCNKINNNQLTIRPNLRHIHNQSNHPYWISCSTH